MKDKQVRHYIGQMVDQVPAYRPGTRTEANTLHLLKQAAWLAARYSVSFRENWYATQTNDEYGAWDVSVEGGYSYLVGDRMTREQYLRTHSSSLSCWQEFAFEWCKLNPDQRLVVENNRYTYHVCVRGEYVEIGLPYHDHGGERHWITRDGKRKLLVNVD